MGTATTLALHPEIDGLTLFSAEPGPHEHAVHAHDAYSIIVLDSGRKAFHHQGDTITVQAEEIAVANPGELHGCGPIEDGHWSHKTWYLSGELMEELGAAAGLAAGVKLAAPKIADKDMAQTLLSAHRASQQGELLDRQSSAIEALAKLVDRFAVSATPPKDDLETDRSQQRTPAYEALMRKHLDQPIDLQRLANETEVSRNQVIRDFHACHGVTPGNYFRQLRLARARELINEGNDLSLVSQITGFADQSHFTRVFRKAFGVTPGEYQKLAQAPGRSAPF